MACCSYSLITVNPVIALTGLQTTPHLCLGFHAAAKIAIFRVLRKIASLTIFRVSCDFTQFFVMLIISKPDRVTDLTKFAKIEKNAKFDDFSCYLLFLVVLCHKKMQDSDFFRNKY